MLYENVFYSHKLTGLFTVWADDKQNPGLINLNRESSEPFAQISFFWSKNGNESRDESEESETNPRLGPSDLDYTVRIIFSDIPLPPKCFTETT